MLKKLFYLFVVLTLTFFMTPQKTSAEVLTWEPMVNSTFTGTRAPGFGDNDNIFTLSMVTFDGYVYVSNYNIALTTGAGTEIWRSNNGTDWEQVNLDNFGSASTVSYAILAVFNGNLYAFNYLDGETHTDVWKYNSGTNWTQTGIISDVTNSMADPYAAVTYDNTLYVSLVNDTDTELAIYESTDGITWTEVNTDALGTENIEAYSMAVYNNYLYIGTYNIGGTEIWRYDGSTWVIDNTIGFDNAENTSTGALTSFGGSLYATTDNSTTGAEVWKTNGGGTTDWTRVSNGGFGQGTQATSATGSEVFKGKLYIGTASSAQVFRSSDGALWEQVNEDHFGYSDNIFAMFAVLGDYLYAGTGNLTGIDRDFDQGDIVIEGDTTEIYRYYEPTPSEAVTLPQTGAK